MKLIMIMMIATMVLMNSETESNNRKTQVSRIQNKFATNIFERAFLTVNDIVMIDRSGLCLA